MTNYEHRTAQWLHIFKGLLSMGDTKWSQHFDGVWFSFPGRQIPRCYVPLRLIQMQKAPVSDTTIAQGEIKRHRSFNKQNKVPFPINHIFEMLCGRTAFQTLKGTLCISWWYAWTTSTRPFWFKVVAVLLSSRHSFGCLYPWSHSFIKKLRTMGGNVDGLVNQEICLQAQSFLLHNCWHWPLGPNLIPYLKRTTHSPTLYCIYLFRWMN